MKVFHNDKLLVIAEQNDSSIDGYFTVRVNGKSELSRFVNRWLMLETDVDVAIYGYAYTSMKNDFISLFDYVKAAGGVVKNDNGDTLFIRRWNMWDLPKGKMEKKETPEETALREVAEETGLTQITIVDKLPETYHIYFDEPPFYLKHSYWFLMSTKQTGQLKPQIEEDITEVVWLDKEQCKKAFSETYRTLREMLENDVC